MRDHARVSADRHARVSANRHAQVSADRQEELLSGLPRTRPHRRSEKRPARPEQPPGKKRAGRPAGKRTSPLPAKRATPPAPPERRHRPVPDAVRAAAEITEIGLAVGARALRRALERLPRP